jgi:hypothetical protein
MLTVRDIFSLSVQHAHASSGYYKGGTMGFIMFKVPKSYLLSRYYSDASSVPSTLRINFALVIILVTVRIPFYKTSVSVEVAVFWRIWKNDGPLFFVGNLEGWEFEHA